jgi:hypothetical protein
MDHTEAVASDRSFELHHALSPRAPAFVRTPTFVPRAASVPSRSEELRDRILAAGAVRDLPVGAVAALIAPTTAPVTASRPLFDRIIVARARAGG